MESAEGSLSVRAELRPVIICPGEDVATSGAASAKATGFVVLWLPIYTAVTETQRHQTPAAIIGAIRIAISQAKP
jgi:hypothetical protein